MHECGAQTRVMVEQGAGGEPRQEFIPIAENIGLVQEIGEFVLGEALFWFGGTGEWAGKEYKANQGRNRGRGLES